MNAITEERLAQLMDQKTEITKEVIDEILRSFKHGEQNHNVFVWLAIIGEEKGEADQAALQAYFEHSKGVTLFDLRKELIQVACTSIKAIASLDRNELQGLSETDFADPEPLKNEKLPNALIRSAKLFDQQAVDQTFENLLNPTNEAIYDRLTVFKLLNSFAHWVGEKYSIQDTYSINADDILEYIESETNEG